MVETQSPTVGDTVQKEASANSVVIEGIYWPYRSAKVLHELGLTEIAEIVEFFSNFQNFVEAQKLTLMEWSAITTIMRKQGLIQEASNGDTVTMETQISDLGLSVRARNGLIRAIHNGDVEDIMLHFADGSKEGWCQLQMTRRLGQKTIDEIIHRFSVLDFELGDDWCYVTDASPVGALDFGRGERLFLQGYQIQTVGQLCAACQDQNRFSGLRYIDNELYEVAIEHLNKYGF